MPMQDNPNLTPVDHLISQKERVANKGHRGGVFWLTGLSASGKSTLAMHAEAVLQKKGMHTYVLDGDNVRRGLCGDLGFSDQDRVENIRRVSETAALMADAGLIVIAAFISPFKQDREKARARCSDVFHEVFIKADLETCEKRDPKGLYEKARAGNIPHFTGVGSPYEEPTAPDLVLDTQAEDIDTCVKTLADYIEQKVRL